MKQGDHVTDAIGRELNRIIQERQIRTVFQPIISLTDGSLLGHEALSRVTCPGEIGTPERLFAAATAHNRLWELELLCRTTALESAARLPSRCHTRKLFININPHTMHDEKLQKGFTKEFLRQYELAPQDLIFEITERNAISDTKAFRAAIDHYRSQDYQIAVDDAGAGYAGLTLISEVNPEYLKLDMSLTRNVDTDDLKAALIKAMVELSRQSNIALIAEGIETLGELKALIDLGVQYGQGYLIQHPTTDIREIAPEILRAVKDLVQAKERSQDRSCIGLLCTDAQVISPATKAIAVYEALKQQPECDGLCILEDDRPVGIITPEKLAEEMSGYFGFTINQNRAIADLMDRDFLAVEHSTSVSVASNLAMSRQRKKLYDFIVVTKDGRYQGIVTIKTLVQRATELEVSNARHQNPLTGLPGNLLIEQELNRVIAECAEYSVAYFDIDCFKAYNDVYGFEQGDMMIKLLANILRMNMQDGQFIGHVGGDDFIVIAERYLAEDCLEEIVRQFDRQALSLYHEADIRTGYIVTNNRHGKVEQFPLITLTRATIDNRHRQFSNAFELTELLAAKKRLAEQAKCLLKLS